MINVIEGLQSLVQKRSIELILEFNWLAIIVLVVGVILSGTLLWSVLLRKRGGDES